MDNVDLHATSIIIDAVCPLLRTKHYVDWYKEGGVTVATPTVTIGDGIDGTIRSLASWKQFIRSRSDLLQIYSVGDIERAKREGRLGLLMHFQGSAPLVDDPELSFIYKELGVGVIQLAYNVRNAIGDGADERTDSGLSYFGLKVIAALNEAKVVIDCSHTGVQTSLDAIDASKYPVVISHGNPRAIYNSNRNIPDDLIKAVASSGGVIGAVGFPGFVGASPNPTLDQYIDHITYMADLVGVDHVGLGIDYYNAQWPVMSDEEAQKLYEIRLANGSWRKNTYPPPPHRYPAGIETPQTLSALTFRLSERGFDKDSIQKILGENWMRVYRAVWG